MCRIIIADDEVIERRVLEMMIGNDFPELELVPSVDNGLALIAGVEKYDPDIAVVDINMPGMNGLDALEMIRARNRRLKIIISTAYSEFEYAKKAISLEVSDYLLKPINRDSFQNILRRVIHQCQQEKETASQKADAKVHMDEMHAVVENEFLSSLMLGEPDERSFRLLLRSQEEYCGCTLVSGRFAEPELVGSRDLGKKILDQMVLTMNSFCHCIGKMHRGEICLLIFSEKNMGEAEERKKLENIFDTVQAIARKEEWPGLCFGVSGRRYLPGEMVMGLQEARIASRSIGKAGVNFYTVKEREKKSHLETRLLKHCIQWMKEGAVDSCAQAVADEVDRLAAEGAGPENLRLCMLELLFCLNETLTEGQDYLLKYSKTGQVDWNGLADCQSGEEIKAWTGNCIRGMTARRLNVGKKSREYVERSLIYMEQHFEEDISLDQAAEASGVSTFYLSRLFKQELDQTFIKILTDIRMSHAMKMVWTNKYTVKEIAEKSGYANITYFYKIFKKYTGMNIGEIREYLS